MAGKKVDLPFKLKAEPEDKLVFKFKDEKTVVLELKVTNILEARQTIKVKCTDNDLFRVRPPLTFIKSGETATVTLTAKVETMPDAGHFFAIYHMASDETEKPARQVWTPEAKAEGVIRIPVFFEKEASEEKAKDETKNEEGKDDKEEKKEEKHDEEKKDEKKENEEVKKDDNKENEAK